MQKVGVPLLAGICLVAMTGGPGRSQEAASPAPEPTIRVTTTEVALDLVVRDKKGRQAKNLKPADVEIFEDGVRQQLLSLRLVPGREVQRREVDNQAKRGPGESLPLREVNTLCIVFHNIDPVTRPHAVEIVKEFIKTDLPPETYIGLFNLNESLAPLHEFTKNRDELLQSIDGSFNGKPLDFARASQALLTASPNIVTVNAQVNNATHSANVSVDVTGGEVAGTTIMGADVSNSTGANRIRGDQVREQSDFANITGMHETDRIITLINQLGTLPGRKTVLLVTTGLSPPETPTGSRRF
jgi:VWFA-related protein